MAADDGEHRGQQAIDGTAPSGRERRERHAQLGEELAEVVVDRREEERLLVREVDEGRGAADPGVAGDVGD